MTRFRKISLLLALVAFTSGFLLGREKLEFTPSMDGFRPGLKGEEFRSVCPLTYRLSREAGIVNLPHQNLTLHIDTKGELTSLEGESLQYGTNTFTQATSRLELWLALGIPDGISRSTDRYEFGDTRLYVAAEGTKARYHLTKARA